MDRFHEMSVFVAVAEAGSFSDAAKQLDMSAPAVTRAVASLEARLGIQLICRTTRHVRMTPAGQCYRDDVRPILEQLENADETLMLDAESPAGEVSIAAPTCISRHFIAPIAAEFLKCYPETQISVVCIDQPEDLENKGFDLCICFGVLPENVAHSVVGKIRDVYCASPSYLQTHGRPNTPADLDGHTLIDNPLHESAHRWEFHHAGKIIPIESKPRLSLSNLDACLAAVSFDFGIAQLASYQVAENIASGAYELVLEEYEPPPYAINVVHRPAHTQTTRARIFYEFLCESIAASPLLQPSNYALQDKNIKTTSASTYAEATTIDKFPARSDDSNKRINGLSLPYKHNNKLSQAAAVEFAA